VDRTQRVQRTLFDFPSATTKRPLEEEKTDAPHEKRKKGETEEETPDRYATNKKFGILPANGNRELRLAEEIKASLLYDSGNQKIQNGVWEDREWEQTKLFIQDSEMTASGYGSTGVRIYTRHADQLVLNMLSKYSVDSELQYVSTLINVQFDHDLAAKSGALHDRIHGCMEKGLCLLVLQIYSGNHYLAYAVLPNTKSIVSYDSIGSPYDTAREAHACKIEKRLSSLGYPGFKHKKSTFVDLLKQSKGSDDCEFMQSTFSRT
jgi:hypothetical protein